MFNPTTNAKKTPLCSERPILHLFSFPHGLFTDAHVMPASADLYNFDSGPKTSDRVEFLSLFHPAAIIIPVEESYARSLTPAESEGSRT